MKSIELIIKVAWLGSFKNLWMVIAWFILISILMIVIFVWFQFFIERIYAILTLLIDGQAWSSSVCRYVSYHMSHTLYARKPYLVSSTANLYHPRWDIIGSLVQIWFQQMKLVVSYGPWYDMVLYETIPNGPYHMAHMRSSHVNYDAYFMNSFKS